MKLVYKPKKGLTRIFGKPFVDNNKRVIKMIVNNKIIDLKTDISFNNIKKSTIKLIVLENIYDLSFMFYNCISLKEISNSSKYMKVLSKENYIDKILKRKTKCIILKNNNNLETFNKNIFYQSLILHEGLQLFPHYNLVELNANKLTNTRSKFCVSLSLNLLPDISKWKTKNIKNMAYMFYGCSSLKSLPDISNWKTINVKHMDYMFLGCSSLKSLPDISKWKTLNLVSRNNIIGKCYSLRNRYNI